jgi:hypothetical protein
MSDEAFPPPLTPSERVALEHILDYGTASEQGLALAMRKGWAATDRGGRGKGALGQEARYRLTEAGRKALEDDYSARLAARGAQRSSRC